MIEDREIWACANLLLKQHGGRAWFVASQRADALFEQGDLDGHRTFARIVRRIKELDDLTPQGAVN